MIGLLRFQQWKHLIHKPPDHLQSERQDPAEFLEKSPMIFHIPINDRPPVGGQMSTSHVNQRNDVVLPRR